MRNRVGTFFVSQSTGYFWFGKKYFVKQFETLFTNTHFNENLFQNIITNFGVPRKNISHFILFNLKANESLITVTNDMG